MAGAGAGLAGGALDAMFVAKDRQKQQGRYRERNEGEPPVKPEHHHQHAQEQAAVGAQNGDALGNHLLDRLGIRGQSCNQVPGPLTIMETQRKALQMREEIPAKGEHEVLRQVAHQAGKVVGQDARNHCYQ